VKSLNDSEGNHTLLQV